MSLYRVEVEQFPQNLFEKQKKNLKLSLPNHINESNGITIFCVAAGHEYFLQANTEKDALEKVLKCKNILPCEKKEKK